ncbi:MAG TPA: DUF3014 domain-containing protein [Steroidobacteraceae bacterium]|nr:DUF3014 domain-containing protein [Steroidobacteraceae bacterium]
MMINKPMIGIAAAVLVIAGGTWYYLRSRGAAPPPAAVAPLPPPAALPPAQPAEEHPLPGTQADAASKTPLPTLADSDAPLRDALSQSPAASALKDYLLPENIIRHLVVTIDNLLRQKVAVEKRPVAPTPGSFVAEGDEQHAVLSPQNYARYQPLVTVISKLDVRQIVPVYVHFYPLFQQAYQDLGYPNGYFNDRLVRVIDSLLATPQPHPPIELVRPNVMYQFADPALESLPAGQKLLIRMGPENAAAVTAKLRELRSAITAAPLKH